MNNLLDRAIKGELSVARHDLLEPLIIGDRYSGMSIDFKGSVLVGHPVVILAQNIQLTNCTVRDSSHGFVYTRGQRSLFQRLHAVGCKIGHYFGSEGFYKNSQVTRSKFDCISAAVCSFGFDFHGWAEVNGSWCNANDFSMCEARDCATGFITRRVDESGCNYNTFSVLHCEQNEINIDCPDWHNNTFVGAHVAEDKKVSAAIIGRHNFIFGGRWMSDIVGNGTNRTQFGGTGTLIKK